MHKIINILLYVPRLIFRPWLLMPSMLATVESYTRELQDKYLATKFLDERFGKRLDQIEKTLRELQQPIDCPKSCKSKSEQKRRIVQDPVMPPKHHTKKQIQDAVSKS